MGIVTNTDALETILVVGDGEECWPQCECCHDEQKTEGETMTTTPQDNEEYTILDIDQNALELTLNDGALWSVFVGDAPTIALWYATQRIRVDPHDDMDYPYRLANLDVQGEPYALAKPIA